MAKRAFEMIKEGMEDAIAYARGDHTRGRAHHFPNAKKAKGDAKPNEPA